MEVQATEADMAKRHAGVVKMDEEVVHKARVVAEFQNLSTAEYLTELVRPLVERDWRAMGHKIVENNTKKGPKPKGGKEG
jgi:hypothetical protein